MKSNFSTLKSLLQEYETYTDENGITWNDEGEGVGPGGVMYQRIGGKIVQVGRRQSRLGPRPKLPPITTKRLYHVVPFAKKDEAKAEGMRWDPDVKRWYHTDPTKSAASKFNAYAKPA